jgi:hypothetical protein
MHLPKALLNEGKSAILPKVDKGFCLFPMAFGYRIDPLEYCPSMAATGVKFNFDNRYPKAMKQVLGHQLALVAIEDGDFWSTLSFLFF